MADLPDGPESDLDGRDGQDMAEAWDEDGVDLEDAPYERRDPARDRTPEEHDRHERQDALLDEGVEETFPASDPVSVKHIT